MHEMAPKVQRWCFPNIDLTLAELKFRRTKSNCLRHLFVTRTHEGLQTQGETRFANPVWYAQPPCTDYSIKPVVNYQFQSPSRSTCSSWGVKTTNNDKYRWIGSAKRHSGWPSTACPNHQKSYNVDAIKPRMHEPHSISPAQRMKCSVLRLPRVQCSA